MDAHDTNCEVLHHILHTGIVDSSITSRLVDSWQPAAVIERLSLKLIWLAIAQLSQVLPN